MVQTVKYSLNAVSRKRLKLCCPKRLKLLIRMIDPCYHNNIKCYMKC